MFWVSGFRNGLVVPWAAATLGRKTDAGLGRDLGRMDLRVGISGWTYAPWRGVFYPDGLPRTNVEAAAVATQHDARMNGRAWLEPGRRRRLRHCVEVRHESFLDAEFFALLRRHRVAFVFADAAGKWPCAEDLTSDFFYVRLHGAEKLYESGYPDPALDDWAARIRYWMRGEARPGAPLVTPPRPHRIRAGYVYFDNDIKVKAPGDAHRLAARLGVEWRAT